MKAYGSRNFSLLVLLVLAIVVAGCSVGAKSPSTNTTADTTSSQQLPFTENKALVVPANTAIYVRLQQSLSSSTAQSGQIFAAVLDEPLIVDGQTLAPEGTAVTGKVVAVRESGHLYNAGYLRITLSALSVNGKSVPLQTNSVFVSGGSYKKRHPAFVGGGTGGGTLLGVLAGGGKGISGAAGAAGGTTAAYATGKKEVGFAAERRLGFLLMQPLSIS